MALSAPAAAEPVLDQQQPLFATNVTMGIGGGPLSDQKLGQVVTAGVAGRLTGVGLLIACDFGSVLQLQIQQAPLQAASTVLSSQLIGGLGPQFSPAFVSYALATPVFVPRGTQFAIVLYSSGSCGTRPGPDGDSYAGGQGYFDARPNQPGWVCLCGFAGPWDLPFQTFVEPGCKVPAVVGQGQTEAVNLISAWGCAPGEPRHEFSSTVPLGSVIAQTPTAGTELAPLAPVSLVFSRGPRPCSVPKLRGLTLKRAKALLHERVCRLGHVRRIHSPLAAGLVIAQHPRGGKVLKPRSKVDVDLSRGPRRR